uniref:Uncharacterized protein n=1 Tax=Rhizophora mucronata TaxID=61149 RepID=A0A2P2N8V0_RHIMU
MYIITIVVSMKDKKKTFGETIDFYHCLHQQLF